MLPVWWWAIEIVLTTAAIHSHSAIGKHSWAVSGQDTRAIDHKDYQFNDISALFRIRIKFSKICLWSSTAEWKDKNIYVRFSKKPHYGEKWRGTGNNVPRCAEDVMVNILLRMYRHSCVHGTSCISIQQGSIPTIVLWPLKPFIAAEIIFLFWVLIRFRPYICTGNTVYT